jgi:hypothetical protein
VHVQKKALEDESKRKQWSKAEQNIQTFFSFLIYPFVV